MTTTIPWENYGVTLTDDDLRLRWGLPLTVMRGLLYGDSDSDRALARYMAMQHQFPKELIEETPTVLRELRLAGLKVGVLTATTRECLEADWDVLGIGPAAFDYIQTVEGSTFHKPDHQVYEPFKSWLAKMGTREEEVVCVGDGHQDRAAALGAGFHFVGVCTGLVTLGELREFGVTAVDSIGGLLA